ncbi:hypothetical protein SAY86_026560 [Trapa natans]|uniref:Uncharacterized protein n=1 Tax=Trapa natans TaxID=22666 RepID=A0AAN7QHU6_TRANT|nr:hypothetical protein SAY86_026560 [Trapa natans]
MKVQKSGNAKALRGGEKKAESSQHPPQHFHLNVEENTNLSTQKKTIPTPPVATTNPFFDRQQVDQAHLYPPNPSPEPFDKTLPPTLHISSPPMTTATPSSSAAAGGGDGSGRDVLLSSSLVHPPPPVQEEKWGTCVMGTPAIPTVHPDNKKAALWGATGEEAHHHHHPYLQYSQIVRPDGGSPMDSMLHTFNSWTKKAETMATNIWQLPSLPGAAWTNVNLRAKAIHCRRRVRDTLQAELQHLPERDDVRLLPLHLHRPVSGSLYLSNIHAAFCSDRPLSFRAPWGQLTWSYYKDYGSLTLSNDHLDRKFGADRGTNSTDELISAHS